MLITGVKPPLDKQALLLLTEVKGANQPAQFQNGN
jgi:hypothetical protein